MVFWTLLGLEALLVGFLGGWHQGLVLLLLTLPLFVYFLSRQKRKLQSLVVVFLDELAKELKLIKVPGDNCLSVHATAVVAPLTKSAPIRIEVPKLADPTPSLGNKEVSVD